MKVSYLGLNTYDGAAPGFEVWPAPSAYCDPSISSASLERTLGLCEKAEALGFDWISVSEHHYAPLMLNPNPIVLAAALTQRVKTAKIALLGPVVPLSNPVRLAEELAMLDVMSGGRLKVLFLRGTTNEYNTYRETTEAQTRSMTREGIDLILKAWREDRPFSWNGENYNFPNVSVWPRVVQQPNPVLYSSGGSEDSIEFAAQRRMGIAFSFAPVEVVRRNVELYRLATARRGWQPTPEHVIYRAMAYIAATDEDAEAEATAYFAAKAEKQVKMRPSTVDGPALNWLVLGRPYFLGGPETVLKAFDVLRRCGVGVVDMVFDIGTHAQQINAIELFAEYVLPTIKTWDEAAFPDDFRSPDTVS